MDEPDWLTATRETCVNHLIGVFTLRVRSVQRAADLAEDGVSFAHCQALSRGMKFESPRHCRNWVLKVARNSIIQTLRSEGHHLELLQSHADAQARRAEAAQRPSPLQAFLDEMSDVLGELPEEDRGLIVLRFVEGRTLQELADEGRGAVTTVWKRIERILRRVREIFEARGAVPHGWESWPGQIPD